VGLRSKPERGLVTIDRLLLPVKISSLAYFSQGTSQIRVGSNKRHLPPAEGSDHGSGNRRSDGRAELCAQHPDPGRESALIIGIVEANPAHARCGRHRLAETQEKA